MNWKVKIRDIKPDAPVHDTVKERFKLPVVVQCASFGAYRPQSLENHVEFKDFYSHSDKEPRTE